MKLFDTRIRRKVTSDDPREPYRRRGPGNVKYDPPLPVHLRFPSKETRTTPSFNPATDFSSRDITHLLLQRELFHYRNCLLICLQYHPPLQQWRNICRVIEWKMWERKSLVQPGPWKVIRVPESERTEYYPFPVAIVRDYHWTSKLERSEFTRPLWEAAQKEFGITLPPPRGRGRLPKNAPPRMVTIRNPDGSVERFEEPPKGKR